MPFVTTWMDLEITIMNEEISQRKTNIYDTMYMQSLKNKIMNITKKNQTHRYREQTSGYQWGEGRAKQGQRIKRYEFLDIK